MSTTEGHTDLNTEALDAMIERFRERYGDFRSQAYLDDERTYKLMAAERMRERLSREALGALIERGAFEEAKAAIRQACQGTFPISPTLHMRNNMLNQWDLQPLIDAPPEELARRLFALLYGDGPFEQRFDAWVALLSEKKPGVWPLATYFLMLHDPARHIFVKPTPFQLFLKTVAGEGEWPTRPDAAKYAHFQRIGELLLERLAPLGAQDLIDAQSFIWQSQYGARAWIFQSRPDLYDLDGALKHLERITWRVSQYASAIHSGDTVYLWEAGSQAGILGVARVLDEPAVREDRPEERPFYKSPSEGPRQAVELQIDLVLPSRLSRAELREDPVLSGMTILKNAQGANFELTPQEAERLADLVEDCIDDDRDDSESALEVVTDVAEWQRRIVTRHSLGRIFPTDFPSWLRERFGGAADFRPLDNQRFSVFVRGRRIMRGRVNQVDGVYIWIPEPAPEIIARLRAGLSRPATLRARERKGVAGQRCVLYNDADYALLKGVLEELIAERFVPPPNPLDGPAFVLMHAQDNPPDQEYGTSYAFSLRAGGAPKRLLDVVRRAMEESPPAPVYAIIYRPGPRYQFTAYARIAGLEQRERDGELSWRLSLEQTELPLPVNPRALDGISWLSKGLAIAFRGISIREITSDEFHTIIRAGGIAMHTALPRTLGDRLRPYVELAARLSDPSYTPAQIVDLLGRARPPLAQLSAAPDPQRLADDLVQLRLLENLGDGSYRRWAHLADATVDQMLRYAALTLLVPQGDGYILPAAIAPFDGQPHPTAAWPGGEPLLNWYAEAGLAQRAGAGQWQGSPDALEPLDAETPTARALGTFLAHLRRVRAAPDDLPPVEDGPLPQIAPDVLEERIREIQRELLVEREVILRIYRSLIAGRHVILSGPPGTGKTHLARLIPRVLWRDERGATALTMPADPALPPTAPPEERELRREGYLAEVVTATEDWGVRHVVGGIAPQLRALDGGQPTLTYAIQHGCLTRAMLGNYAGYEGDAIPETLARADVADDAGRRYRGRWLIIDEFTRAQVDAAFGGLLTTLGGQDSPTLAVPVGDGEERHVPLPRDFRLIGTLNSFDRHFLNQISEAMKRRFSFIDILPPGRDRRDDELGMVLYRSIARLHAQRMHGFVADLEAGSASYRGISVRRRQGPGEPLRYVVSFGDGDEARDLIDRYWRIISAVRVYRMLGTAQAEAVCTDFLAGDAIGMGGARALDSALADTLADQLQVLNRDEQLVLLAYIEHAAQPEQFARAFHDILARQPSARQQAHLSLLRAVSPQIDQASLEANDAARLGQVFDLGQPLAIGGDGLFAGRLRAFVHERGL